MCACVCVRVRWSTDGITVPEKSAGNAESPMASLLTPARLAIPMSFAAKRYRNAVVRFAAVYMALGVPTYVFWKACERFPRGRSAILTAPLWDKFQIPYSMASWS